MHPRTLAAADRRAGVLPLPARPLHLHPDGGETIRIEAGDALLLPENSLGVWDVQETVRKSYVIIHR